MFTQAKPDTNCNNVLENILLSRTSKYKIADLGLSRIAEITASEDINEGDSRYLAPELLNDSSDNLPDLTKADIFSLGVTIYELMIGSIHFNDSSK